MKFGNVFFDLDGTLTDPREGIARSMQYAIAELGLPPISAETLESSIGRPLRDVFGDFLEETGSKSVERTEKAVTSYRERFTERGLFENSVHEEVLPLLSSLLTAGVCLFVVTTKPTVYAERIIDHFDLTSQFKKVYGSELDGTRTDKAELIKYVLNREGILPDSTVMVGDRSYDISGAKSNGVKAIGVLWGFGSLQELSDAGAWKLCGSPGELLEILLKSGGS